MAEIGRLLTAMVTPFDEEGKVGYEQAQRLALALLDSGSDGVVLAGTTGEAPTLSHEEKIRLFGLVKQAVGDRGAVIAGTGTYNTAESVELSREAEFVAQVDGLLLTCPYYNRPPQGDLYAHFSRIASSVPIPCILYNIPSRTGVNMTAETTLKLLEDIPNIVGIKEASGNMDQILHLILHRPEGFSVLSGDDNLTVPFMAWGGDGVVSVVSNAVPKPMSELTEAMHAGDLERLRSLVLTRDEFWAHVWPYLPASRPERNVPFGS